MISRIDTTDRTIGRGFAAIALVMMMTVAASGTTTAQNISLDDMSDSVSYSVGVNFATSQILPLLENLAQQGAPIDKAIFARAINDILAERSTILSDSVAQATLVAFQRQFVAQIAATAKKQGEEFLAQNGSKEGVVTTPSGLQYMVMEQGNGSKPDGNDQVTVRYRGYRVDGVEFDKNTSEAGVTFAANRVIKGWTEALQLMSPGAKYRLFIPSNLAYGANPQGEVIRPNETLIFDVEMISFESVD